ncbi:MAG: D-alanine--D-alanine ligase [bacterium]
MSGIWKGKKVAVLLGGVSKEREISLRTGNAITEGLRRLGYDVATIDVQGGVELVASLCEIKPQVAVVALHGKFGEDGCVQGLLEMMRIPYTGGGVLASAVGMDKIVCKRLAMELGITCPRDAVYDAARISAESFARECPLPMPVIVKPSREGSTINMTIVNDAKDLASALKIAEQSDNKILVEQYIPGREITVGILNGMPLPALEIAPKSGFYDYSSKYTKGATEYIVPARIGEKIAAKLGRWTEQIYTAIECDGMARADFIVTSDDEAYFLEINTIPGMTELSLVPKAAAHIGITFDEVCERLLDGAKLKVN